MDKLIDWKAVFWDFDGVILDSVNVKTEAFSQMFSQYGPEIQKAVVEYHLNHGGISRFEKFRHYYQEFLKMPITDDELSRLNKEFSALVVQKVIQSPYIEGALENLELLKMNKIPCYVVSGTPEKEITFIIESKGLRDFFTEIHGAPKTKAAILDDIMLRGSYRAVACLYLGDAMTDYEAAVHAGVHFHGIVPDGAASPFPEDIPTSSRVFI